jgi:hypothetical protein
MFSEIDNLVQTIDVETMQYYVQTQSDPAPLDHLRYAKLSIVSIPNPSDAVGQFAFCCLETKLNVVQATCGKLFRSALCETYATRNQIRIQSGFPCDYYQSLEIIPLQRFAARKSDLQHTQCCCFANGALPVLRIELTLIYWPHRI